MDVFNTATRDGGPGVWSWIWKDLCLLQPIKYGRSQDYDPEDGSEKAMQLPDYLVEHSDTEPGQPYEKS